MSTVDRNYRIYKWNENDNFKEINATLASLNEDIQQGWTPLPLIVRPGTAEQGLVHIQAIWNQ